MLDVLISGKKKDLKKLTIFGKGSGKRRLLASYTVETPVWKTSYRILLSGAGPLSSFATARSSRPSRSRSPTATDMAE